MKKKFRNTRANSQVVTQKIVSSEHLNSNGKLFGGYLMCWIDEVAYLCARRYTGTPNCVTVNIDNITFTTPIHQNEHVLLTARVNYTGNTSLEIEVNVEIEDPRTRKRRETNSAHLTFVCLSEKNKPVKVPALTLEGAIDHQKHKEAQFRIKMRKRLRLVLERKFSKPTLPPPAKIALPKGRPVRLLPEIIYLSNRIKTYLRERA